MRELRRVWLATVFAIAGAGAVAVTVLALTGGLSGGRLDDPGVVVRFGLPVVTAAVDICAALTIGALLTAVFWAPAANRSLAVLIASVAAWGWAASAVVRLLLAAADVIGTPVFSATYFRVLPQFVGSLELGQILLLSAIVATCTALTIYLHTKIATLGVALLLAVAALAPIALTGHASGAYDHMNAVNSLAIHLCAAVVWAGGLAVVVANVMTSACRGPDSAGRHSMLTHTMLTRYSAAALMCFVCVTVSGVVNAGLRLSWRWANLDSSYGAILIAKAVALTALGYAGYVHRRRTLARLDAEPAMFRRFAAGELAVMTATFGLAAALSRSAPPSAGQQTNDVFLARIGFARPPALTWWRLFTVWHVDIAWAMLAVGAVAGYLVCLRRVSQWPRTKVYAWVAAWLVFVLATCGGLGVYSYLHRWVHVVAHLVIMIVGGPLLVWAAPVRLVYAAIAPRSDGSVGWSEALRALGRSRVTRVVRQPLVSVVLVVTTTWLLLGTGLFSRLMLVHPGHVAMIIQALAGGCLLAGAFVATPRVVE